MIEWLRDKLREYTTRFCTGAGGTWKVPRLDAGEFIHWLEQTGASPWEIVTDGMGLKFSGEGLIFDEPPPDYVMFTRGDRAVFGMPLPPLPKEKGDE